MQLSILIYVAKSPALEEVLRTKRNPCNSRNGVNSFLRIFTKRLPLPPPSYSIVQLLFLSNSQNVFKTNFNSLTLERNRKYIKIPNMLLL